MAGGAFIRLDAVTAAHLVAAIRAHRHRFAQHGGTPDRLVDIEYFAREISTEAIVNPAPAREAQQLGLSQRRGVDPIARWLEECCELDDAAVTSVADAAAAYENWADGEGEDPITPMKLTLELRKHGIGRARTKSARLYRGLRVTGSGDSLRERHRGASG